MGDELDAEAAFLEALPVEAMKLASGIMVRKWAQCWQGVDEGRPEASSWRPTGFGLRGVVVGFELNPDFEEELLRATRAKLGDTMTADEMFTVEFMQTHTKFSSFDEMVAASPIAGTDHEQLASDLDRPDWNAFVAENSSFASWSEMQSAAASALAAARLNP